MPESTADQSRSTATAFRSAAQIRRDFLDFFCEKHGHTFAPSSPVVPHDDPTLLFTNAGMNQFKDVFLGQGTRPYTRAANSQKCIRAGGKHNDLEDVGKDTYHHTFFEMLGNWSFGDYFKAEAIAWAWELLVDVWGVDPTRLYVTYFEGDESQGLKPDTEARELWLKYLPEDHVLPGNMKDNFWEMGDTGPCGPCSEVHYDATPGKGGRELVNAGDPRVIEIWNLVFIQFNRERGGRLTPLPAKHVDTGMGFERITRVLQGKESNYDTDIWTPIFEAIREKTGARPYQGGLEDAVDIAYRVVADHIRCLTVAITDGATPSNEGRGYVLRRILRRAVRVARQTLGVEGPVLCELVPAVVDSLGDAFLELKQNPKRIADVIRAEEEAFLKTIDRGIELFESACGLARSGTISADNAFKLHDTYGFPIDLTCVMAAERGVSVDVAGFERLMEQAREKSRAGTEQEESFTLTPGAIDELGRLGAKPTDDHYKYNPRPLTAKIEAIWNGADFDNSAHIGRRVAVILDRTNHYAESGGQVGDTGEIGRDYEAGFGRADSHRAGRFEVEDTQTVAGYVLHIGRVTDGRLRVGERVQVAIDRKRRLPIQANHTATHLLNFALREVIGESVDQKGSLVAPDRLRFDFSARHGMKPAEIERVESIVNDFIQKNLPVQAEEMPLEQARSIDGVRAVFGEKYPDPVRVVAIAPAGGLSEMKEKPHDPKWRQYSVEFCGGTHLNSTGEVRSFVLTGEGALAAGVRRVTALTGEAAVRAREAGEKAIERLREATGLEGDSLVRAFDSIAGDIEQIVTSGSIKARLQEGLDALREKVKQVRKKSQASARDEVVERARQIADSQGRDAHATVIIECIDGADKDLLLAAMDVIRAKCEESAVMLFSTDEAEGKVAIAAAVPKPLIEKGLKAGDWVREAAKACGGGGGGRPDMAQAGGKDPSRVADAMNIARDFAQARVA